MPSLVITNFGFVLLFGISLSISFADISLEKNFNQYLLISAAFGILQIIVYFCFGITFLFKSYPILVHLPLFLLLKFYYNKNVYVAGISVLSAYLFCTPRKWVGTFMSSFWDYNIHISYIIQILITIPLMLIIMKYISPYVARLKFEDDKILKLFIAVPLIYYVIEYCITVYTNLLYEGGAVIVEFMDAAVVIIYFIFSIIYLKTLYEKKEIEIEQALLVMMANQSKVEMEALRQSQKQAAIYRHDLRHHLNYLSTCISENNSKDALAYIAESFREIDHTNVIKYSDNESINLIISAYDAKSQEKNIYNEIKITATDFDRFAMLDLCSLLSNAFENAIHACEKISNKDNLYIKLRMYTKNNKLCVEIRNSYWVEPIFEQGLPISKEQGHGIGTKSITHVVEKYAGLYQFSVINGEFIFQSTM
jgi:hypothetical protein